MLINVNITDITDESGYIDAIGQKAASQAIQQARGDVAEQEKMGEIRVAEAERDKADPGGQRRQAARDRHARGEARAGRAQVAELEKEQKVGEQTAGVRARGRRSRTPSSEMRIQLGRRQRQGRSTARTMAQATIAALAGRACRSRRPKPTRSGETPQARGRGGRARSRRTAPWPRPPWPRPSASRPSSGPSSKPRPRPRRPGSIVEAEAEAEKRRIEAEGEAAAIFAKLEAEARGQYEILAKKGEGLKQIIEACGGAEQAFQLLMLEHLDNLAEASAKAISNIKFDKVVVWEGNGQNGTQRTANFLHNMARTLPPMMQVMKDIGGVEMPETLANLTNMPAPQPAENGDGAPVVAAK